MKKKIILSLVVILVICLILAVSLFSAGVSQQTSIEWVESNNGTVEFEIKNWAKSIPFEESKNLIGKKITAASLNGAKLDNLSKLEVFKDCEVLTIQNCTIGDYSSIAKLKKIKKLHILNSNIKNLLFLKESENLEYLELANTKDLDLSALADLKNLKTIKLKGSAVKNIAPLGALKQIEVLDLTSTKVENILPLQNLKNLKQLHIAETNIPQKHVVHIQEAIENCVISSNF